MCIRDRVPSAQAVMPNPTGDELLPESTGTGLTLLLVLVDVCLLYTSDAADERSSVDLGGPRILKKNTHTQHTHTHSTHVQSLHNNITHHSIAHNHDTTHQKK